MDDIIDAAERASKLAGLTLDDAVSAAEQAADELNKARLRFTDSDGKEPVMHIIWYRERRSHVATTVAQHALKLATNG